MVVLAALAVVVVVAASSDDEHAPTTREVATATATRPVRRKDFGMDYS
jgi:hypothetical protein